MALINNESLDAVRGFAGRSMCERAFRNRTRSKGEEPVLPGQERSGRRNACVKQRGLRVVKISLLHFARGGIVGILNLCSGVSANNIDSKIGRCFR